MLLVALAMQFVCVAAPVTGSKPLSGWTRTAMNGRDDVWVADVSSFKFTRQQRLFFYRGTRMELCRYPNFEKDHPITRGWAFPAEKRDRWDLAKDHDPLDEIPLTVGDYREWSNPSEGCACIFPKHNWWNRVVDIKDVDPARKTVRLARSLQRWSRPWGRVCFWGLREELDAPGEWYHDLKNAKVYFIPPDGGDPNMARTALVDRPAAMELNGVADRVIEGLEICEAADGIVLNNCTNVTVVGCRIHDIGFDNGCGVTIRAGRNCRVVDCDIWNIGSHGISICETGPDGSRPPAEDGLPARLGHRVENCYIHHVGQIYRHGIGVDICCAGATVEHNLLHDCPRGGIFPWGWFNRVAFNRIRHTNLEMDDTAAIYCGGWTGCVGTEIVHNWISDTIGFMGSGDKWRFHTGTTGVYVDEAGGGVTIAGNIVEGSAIGGFALHNARYCTVSNNVFVSNGCQRDDHARQYGMTGWDNAPKGYFRSIRQKDICDEWDRLLKRCPRAKEYPSIADDPHDPFLAGSGYVMKGNHVVNNVFWFADQPSSALAVCHKLDPAANKIDRNVIWNGNAVSQRVWAETVPNWEKWRAAGLDARSTLADPQFADVARHDFRLGSGSPARQLGFVEIPQEEIGLRPSKWRKLPVREAEGVREHPEWLVADEPAQPFPDGARVVFLGDSITHHGHWHKFVSDWYFLVHPERKVFFRSAGVGGDTASGCVSRIDEDVAAFSPTDVTVMFGMNDVGRNLYVTNPTPDILARRVRRQEDYSANMLKLVERLGALEGSPRLWLFTPSPFDDTSTLPAPNNPGCNAIGLSGLAKRVWQLQRGVPNSTLVDMHDPLTELNLARQRTDPAFTICGKDRIHPWLPGGLAMAYQFLKTQNAQTCVSRVDIRCSEDSAYPGACERAKVRNVRKAKGTPCSFSVTEEALPLPLSWAVAPVTNDVPFLRDFASEKLVVKGLPPGTRWSLDIDGNLVGSWNCDELGCGVELSQNSLTPMNRQAQEVLGLTEERYKIEQKLTLLSAVRWWLRNCHRDFAPDDLDGLRKLNVRFVEQGKSGYYEGILPKYIELFPSRAKLLDEMLALDDRIRAAARPVAHEWCLKDITNKTTARE